MKKMNVKKNGFNVVSHKYILYGYKQDNACYIHFKDKTGTCFTLSGFPWADVLKLVRGKISWKTFAGIVYYEHNMQMQQDFKEYYNL